MPQEPTHFNGIEQAEEWRTVPEFPAYRVSNLGNFQACYRQGRHDLQRERPLMTNVWRPLKPWKHPRGYLEVSLSRDGRGYRRLAHRVVLEAFVGPCPQGMEARHVNNNDRTNNRLANLRWGTRQDNADDRSRHGTQVNGSRCWKAALTEEDVRKIRRLRANGMPVCVIARRFPQTTRENIWKVCRGQTWKHIAI